MSDGDECSDGDSRESYRPSCMYINPPPPTDGQPYLQITEQPQARGFRFRYECEGKSHGGLQGENSRREKKTYPSVQICRYRGPAKLTVSLVTDEQTPRPHAHELIGKNCSDGIYSVFLKASENIDVSCPNIGIRHVTKKSVTSILIERLREQFKADKMMVDGNLGQNADLIQLPGEAEALIKKEAEAQAKSMNLSVVRLCFRAYLIDENGVCTQALRPVFSNPVFDSKAPCASVLRICRIDKVGGCCSGNEEIYMLCDKIQKDDIAVRFYEQDDEGNIKWEGYGRFGPHDVHRQFAIVFHTPPYLSTTINQPVKVFVQLRRLSDNEVSDSKTFTYYPQITDREEIQRKRKKALPSFVQEVNLPSTNPTNIDFMRLLAAHRANSNAQPLHPTPASSESRMSQGPFYVSAGAGRRLEEDSVAEVDLVSRSWPVDKFDPAKAEPSIDISKNRVAKVDSFQQESSSNTVSISTADKDTQTAVVNDELVLLRTLEHMFERTNISMQHYSQTGDVRHLLMPGRHLISSRNEDGDNAVHLSVIHCQSSAARNLLAVLNTLPSNAAIDDRNDLLQTPLQLAVITRQSDLVELLLDHGADPCSVYDHRSGNSLLHIASRDGDSKSLKLLINRWRRSTPSSKWTPGIDTHNFEGFTALHLAVICGHLEAVQLLIQLGHADVNLGDGRCGQTALHHAVAKHNLAILGYLLLECSADVDKPDDSGNTPLHHASSSNKVDVAALLMAAGANPDLENFSGIDSESDSEDEDVKDGPNEELSSEEQFCIGATARDLAEGNSKMIRILEGEEYRSIIESSPKSIPVVESTTTSSSSSIGSLLDPRLRSVIDSGIDSIHLHSSGRLSSLETGDMNRLDALVRMKLSKLLDPPRPRSDWRELAGRLKLGILHRGLELQKSPTRALLDNYEMADGMVVELRKCLLEMNRTDAVDLVDSALQ